MSFDKDNFEEIYQEIMGNLKMSDFFLMSKDIVALFQYKGFDPKSYQCDIVKKIENCDQEFSSIGGKVKDCGPLIIDLLIGVYYMIGNNIEKITSKSFNSDVAKEMQELFIHLGITSKVSAASDFTLARTAAAFPHRCASLFKNVGRLLIDVSDLNLKDPVVAMPLFVSVAPKSWFTVTGIQWVTFLCAIRLNQVIGNKSTTYERQWQFHKLAINSNAIEDTVRVTTCGGDGLQLDFKDYETAIAHSKDQLKQVLPDELFKAIENVGSGSGV